MKLADRILSARIDRAAVLEFIISSSGATLGEIVRAGIAKHSTANNAFHEFLAAGLIRRIDSRKEKSTGLQYRYVATVTEMPAEVEKIIKRARAEKVEVAARVLRVVTRDPWDVALFGAGPARVTDYDALRAAA